MEKYNNWVSKGVSRGKSLRGFTGKSSKNDLPERQRFDDVPISRKFPWTLVSQSVDEVLSHPFSSSLLKHGFLCRRGEPN